MAEDLLELNEEETEEQPADGEQPAEGADNAEQPAEGQEEQVTSLFDADGKKVAEPIRKTLAKLKTENPSVGKLITDAVYRAAEFRREFPGGLTEARELRDRVEELGGIDTVREQLAGAAELNELARAFANGDPAFVDDMVVSDKEAFSSLAPVVFDRYKEVSPEGWSSYLAKAIYSDIQANDIPLYVMRLADVVKDKPEAVQLLQAISGYLGSFKELAAKTPAAPQRRTVEQPRSDNREEQLRAREWNADRRELQTTIKTAAITRALAGRKPNTEEKAQIEELFTTRAARLAKNYFKDWEKVSQGYIARDDKRGYLRYMESIYRRVMPEAMSSAVASTLKGQRPASTGALAKPGAKVAVKPAEGFTLVAKEPDTYNIDYGRTSRAMLAENKAILRDGKKVQWRDAA
jgi:hypothetical protein